MKRKTLLSLFFLATFTVLFAQEYSLTPTVISTAGHFNSTGGYSLSGTIGELAVTTLDPGGSYILTQGFQQPFELDVQDSSDDLLMNWSVSAYPNPVSDFLNVRFNIENPVDFIIEIIDITGKKLWIRNFPEITPQEVISIDLSRYVRGVYMLRISTPDRKVNKIYKIQKF